jgi:hypothetical protein
MISNQWICSAFSFLGMARFLLLALPSTRREGSTLANAFQTKLRRLLGSEPRFAERIDVHSMESLGLRLADRAADSRGERCHS